MDVFAFRAFRFQFKTHGPIFFPRGMAGNTFRGAFGHIFRRICEGEASSPYTRIFEPQSMNGPSGFLDAPRPFVLRPRDLEERQFQPEDTLCLDVHFFALEEKLLAYFVLTFLQLAREGLGPRRVSIELITVRALSLQRKPTSVVWSQEDSSFTLVPPPLQIELHPVHRAVDRLRTEFRTPTELKSEGTIAKVPEFSVLFGRVRDRISTLASFYGQPLHFDFKAMGERSKSVKLAGSQLQWEQTQRKSSRTGQRHSLNGFIGWTEYQGDLREFAPWLEAAYWSGVGRQTVWGKGEITIKTFTVSPGRSDYEL